MSDVTICARLTASSNRVRAAYSTSASLTSPSYSAYVGTVDGVAKITLTGLSASTTYYYAIEVNDELKTSKVGKFKTPAVGAQSFTCAFSGDAELGSNHAVFGQILSKNPLLFIHLGDMHYANITENKASAFYDAYDGVFSSAGQEALYRQVPTLYMWDDHDFGPDDSYGGSPARDAACAAYRVRVPSPALVESSGPVYFTHKVGRVLFIFTDQRSQASNKTDTDNSSKSILGATQKAWFKSVLTDPANAGLLFVWICTRVWGGVATAGADHWGGFTTERTELADYIKANCLSRFCVISADMHSLAIDSGANHNFATGGGAPIPTFQASPLDKTGAETYGGGTYDQGAGRYLNNGQFGVMEVTDTGGSSIGIAWKGYDSTGTLLVSYSFTRTVS